MTWHSTWQVKCERCGAIGPRRRLGADAERVALARGWARGHFYGCALHLCPECVAKGLPDWWPDATGLRFHWED